MRLAWLLLGLVACTPRSERAPDVRPEPPPPQARPKMTPPSVKDLGTDTPLEEGSVRWEGMVRPTKGGYEVRGVTVDGGIFRDKLEDSALDGLPSDPEWFVGAVVRVTGVLEKISHDDPPNPGGLAVQTRSGTWFHPKQVNIIELVRNAQQIEGTMTRSKGLWAVDKYLVNHRDLEWALVSGGGGKAGINVRIWGQPRVYQCDPREQCLQGGSIPFFEVARARVLP